MAIKVKKIPGVEFKSPLEDLMSKLDDLTEEYYPTVVNSYKSVFPDFSKASSLSKTTIYRANMPGYFYRLIGNPSSAAGSNSVVLFSFDPVHIDFTYLGVYVPSGKGKTGEGPFGDAGEKRVTWGMWEAITEDTLASWQTRIGGSHLNDCDKLGTYIQLRKSDEGVSSDCLSYFCNRGDEYKGGIGSQLVPIIPGAGSSTYRNQGEYLSCIDTLLVVYVEDGKCCGLNGKWALSRNESGEPVSTAHGFYFQYYSSDAGDSLYFVPTKYPLKYNTIKPVTSIRTSGLSTNYNSGLRYKIGDMCPTVYRTKNYTCPSSTPYEGETTDTIFSPSHKGVVVSFNYLFETPHAEYTTEVKLKTSKIQHAGDVYYENRNEYYGSTSSIDSKFISCFSGGSLDGLATKFLVADVNVGSIPSLHGSVSSLYGVTFVTVTKDKAPAKLDTSTKICSNDYSGNLTIFDPTT